MKTTRLTKTPMWTVAATLGVCASIAVAMAVPRVASAADNPKDSGSGLLAPLKQWQEKMSDAFRDAFKGMTGAGAEGAKAAGASSVSADLREQNDSYMLRLNLPGRTLDKVEVNLEGNRLRIVAPEEGATRRYEQTITLGDLPADAKARVERKQEDHLIVVTVPKSSPAAASATPPERRTEDLGPLFRRDHEIMDSMDRMRRDMDRIFEDSFKAFKYLPGYSGWFDEYRFGSTYEMSDAGDHYVVRVYLPARDMDNVSVKVEGQTLHIDAKAEDSAGGSKGKEQAETRVHRAAYAQRVTLPGPVDALKMTVDRKDHMLVVTLPKSKTP